MISPRRHDTALVPRSMMSSCCARVSGVRRQPFCGVRGTRLGDDTDSAAALGVHLARHLDGVAGRQVRVARRDRQDEAALTADVRQNHLADARLQCRSSGA